VTEAKLGVNAPPGTRIEIEDIEEEIEKLQTELDDIKNEIESISQTNVQRKTQRTKDIQSQKLLHKYYMRILVITLALLVITLVALGISFTSKQSSNDLITVQPSPTSTPIPTPITTVSPPDVYFIITFASKKQKIPAGDTLSLKPGETILIETSITTEDQSLFPDNLTYHYFSLRGSIPEKHVGPTASYVAPDQPGPDVITVLIVNQETGDEILSAIFLVVEEKEP
jgi:hypothetical protein